MKAHVLLKIQLAFLLLMFSSLGFSLPSYPKDKEVEADLKNNWKVQGEQGKLLSVKKEGNWEKKVLVNGKVKYLTGFIKYSAKVEFDGFVRNFNVNVVYILEQNEWIYDKNVILNWTDEQKKGEKTFSKDEIKAKIKSLTEKQDQAFWDKVFDFQKNISRDKNLTPIKGPVKVSKVLVTDPEVKGKKIYYYADIDLEDSSANKFTYINMQFILSKKTSDQKEWDEKLWDRLGRYEKK